MTKTMKFREGDRVQCYRPAPEGAVGTVVAVRPRSDSPYKVQWDRPDPFTGKPSVKWISRAVVVGTEGATRWPTWNGK